MEELLEGAEVREGDRPDIRFIERDARVGGGALRLRPEGRDRVEEKDLDGGVLMVARLLDDGGRGAIRLVGALVAEGEKEDRGLREGGWNDRVLPRDEVLGGVVAREGRD